jgi:hypothetical protein
MAYDLKITGLANRDELVDKGPQDFRLYKFSLNHAPDGFWVLLLQSAGLKMPEVTLSANADQVELWATANADVSVKTVLAKAKQAVSQANADANESDAQFNSKAEEKAAAMQEAQQALVAELDDLDFSDEPASASDDADVGGLDDMGTLPDPDPTPGV